MDINSPDYQAKLAGIEAMLADIKGKTGAVSEQVQRAGQMTALSGKPLTPETEIPETYNYQKAFQTGQFAPTTPPVASTGIKEISNDNIPTDNLASVIASKNLIARTNNLTVDTEPSESLTPADYFGQSATDILKQLQGMALDSKSKADLLTEKYEEYGVQKTFDELKNIQTQALSIRTQIDKLEQQKLDAIDAVEKRGGMDMSSMNAQKNRIINDSNREVARLSSSLSVMSATGAMLQGQLTTAVGFANTFVNASIFDQEQKWNDLVWLQDTYVDLYDRMQKDEKAVWDAQVKQAKFEYDEAKDIAEQKAKWLVDPDFAGAFLGRDINTMSLPEMATAIQDHLILTSAKGGDEILSVAEAKSLGVPFGTKKSQAYGITPTTTTTGDDSQRVANAKATIQRLKGSDNLVSRETYTQMAQDWIAQGGTASDFKFAFPPESLMNQGNIDLLPEALKPSGGLTATEQMYLEIMRIANQKKGE